SDVRALAEMVEHERTGLIHSAGDANYLARRLTWLVASSRLRQELGENARAWVSTHRSCRTLAGVVDATYLELLGHYRAPYTSPSAGIPRIGCRRSRHSYVSMGACLRGEPTTSTLSRTGSRKAGCSSPGASSPSRICSEGTTSTSSTLTSTCARSPARCGTR